MTGIYKITKIDNGKSYIGQSNDIYRRFKEHKYKTDIPIEIAIKKYGADNFKFEILEECSIQQLDEREKYWIKYYNTYNGFGYNCSEGGGISSGENNGKSKLKEQDVEYIRECYNQHKRSKEVYEKYKEVLSYGSFMNLWEGRSWPNIKKEVYTKENLEYYKHHTTDGVNSNKAKFTKQEVMLYRKRYQFETAEDMYPEVKDKISIDAFKKILWGYRYKNLPIYKKKEKKWVNTEACNDYPL